MEKIVCCKCGIEFHVSPEWTAYRFKDGNTFYCPNGHQQRFTERTHVPKGEMEALQRENDALMRRVEMLEAQLAEALEGRKESHFDEVKRRAKAKVDEAIGLLRKERDGDSADR